MPDPALTRRLIYFQGHVQGVGFRFTTCRVAARFDVAGFVRNLPDGRVELVVEGKGSEIDRFLDALREAMSGYIRHADVHMLPATGEFDSFGIRHG